MNARYRDPRKTPGPPFVTCVHTKIPAVNTTTLGPARAHVLILRDVRWPTLPPPDTIRR